VEYNREKCRVRMHTRERSLPFSSCTSISSPQRKSRRAIRRRQRPKTTEGSVAEPQERIYKKARNVPLHSCGHDRRLRLTCSSERKCGRPAKAVCVVIHDAFIDKVNKPQQCHGEKRSGAWRSRRVLRSERRDNVSSSGSATVFTGPSEGGGI